MAQTSKTTFFNLAIVLTLVLMIISVAESINLIGVGEQDTLSCNAVHGAETGETCSTVAQEFDLSLQDFLTINPNINCDAMFVGQWLCVAGSA